MNVIMRSISGHVNRVKNDSFLTNRTCCAIHHNKTPDV